MLRVNDIAKQGAAIICAPNNLPEFGFDWNATGVEYIVCLQIRDTM